MVPGWHGIRAHEREHSDMPQLHLAGDYEHGKNRSYEKAGEQHELRERASVDAVCHQAAKGGYDEEGIIEAKVMMPTQPDESDLLRMNHELATMNVHIAAPENIFAVHVIR